MQNWKSTNYIRSNTEKLNIVIEILKTMYKNNTKIKEKKLRATTLAIAKLEEHQLYKKQYRKFNIVIEILKTMYKNNTKYKAKISRATTLAIAKLEEH